MKYVITALLLIASSVVHGQVYVHWQEEQTIYNGAGDATVRRSCHASDGAFVVKTYHYQATAPELAELNLYGRDDGYVTEVSLLLGAVLAERRRLAEDLVLANPPGDTPAISNESALLPGPEHAFRTFRYRFQVDTEWIYPPRGGWYERRGQDTTETAILPVYNPTSLGRISFTPLMQTNPKTSVTLSLSLLQTVMGCCVPRPDALRFSFHAKRIATDASLSTGSAAMIRISLDGLATAITNTYVKCRPPA